MVLVLSPPSSVSSSSVLFVILLRLTLICSLIIPHTSFILKHNSFLKPQAAASGASTNVVKNGDTYDDGNTFDLNWCNSDEFCTETLRETVVNDEILFQVREK